MMLEPTVSDGPTPQAELVFTVEAKCEMPQPLGRIDGGEARMIPIVGGRASGALTGDVLPGADWAITFPDGRVRIDARYAIRADDGAIIQVQNGITDRMNREAAAAGPPTLVTHPRFIAPEGPHAWLNEGLFAATIRPEPRPEGLVVAIRVYRIRLA